MTIEPTRANYFDGSGASSPAGRCIFVLDAPETLTWEDRIRWAVRTAYHQNVDAVVLPQQNIKFEGTCDLSRWTSGDRGATHCLSGIKIIGNGCQIRWNSTASGENKAFFELPSPDFIHIVGKLILNGQTTSGETVDGTIGIWYRGGWEYEKNASRQIKFSLIVVKNCWTGFWVGDMGGPDLVGTKFELCRTENCEYGWVFQGPNVTGMTLDTCFSTGFKVAVRAIGQGSLDVTNTITSEAGDPWWFEFNIPGSSAGNQWLHTTFPGDVWANRMIAGTTTLKGGGPTCTVYNFIAHSLAENVVTFQSEDACIWVRDARLEGVDNLAWKNTGNQLPDPDTTRLHSLLDNVDSVRVGGGAIEMNGGRPLRVVGGRHYSVEHVDRADIDNGTYYEGVAPKLANNLIIDPDKLDSVANWTTAGVTATEEPDGSWKLEKTSSAGSRVIYQDITSGISIDDVLQIDVLLRAGENSFASASVGVRSDASWTQSPEPVDPNTFLASDQEVISGPGSLFASASGLIWVAELEPDKDTHVRLFYKAPGGPTDTRFMIYPGTTAASNEGSHMFVKNIEVKRLNG